MAKIRKTKKAIKKSPWGPIWVDHAKFWLPHSFNPRNDYKTISWFFYTVDVAELVKITKISKEKIQNYINICLS